MRNYDGASIAANYFVSGKESLGGKLFFDNSGIHFKSHLLNIHQRDFTLEYNRIKKAEQYALGIAKTGMLVLEEDGTEHIFVVNHREDVISFINTRVFEYAEGLTAASDEVSSVSPKADDGIDSSANYNESYTESIAPFCEVPDSSQEPFAEQKTKRIRFLSLGAIGIAILVVATIFSIRTLNEANMKKSLWENLYDAEAGRISSHYSYFLNDQYVITNTADNCTVSKTSANEFEAHYTVVLSDYSSAGRRSYCPEIVADIFPNFMRSKWSIQSYVIYDDDEREDDYQQALQYYSSGCYSESYAILTELEGYKDSSVLQNEVMFLAAEDLFNNYCYDEAKELYKNVTGSNQEVASERLKAIDCVKVADLITAQLKSEKDISQYYPDWYLSMFGLDFTIDFEYDPKENIYYYRTIYPSSFSDISSLFGMSLGSAVNASGGMDQEEELRDIFERFLDKGITDVVICGECYDSDGECFASENYDYARYQEALQKQKEEDDANGITRNGDFEIKGSTLVKYNGNDSDIVIPDGVTTIGTWVFENNETLESVTMPDTVEEIRFGAFSGCPNLKTVLFSNNLKIIGAEAFNFSGLEEVQFPKSLAEVEGPAFANTQLKKVSFEKGTKNIPENLLYCVNGDVEVTIPEGVTTIESYSLGAPGKIYFPASLASIEENSIYISNMYETEIFFNGTVSQWDSLIESMFASIPDYYDKSSCWQAWSDLCTRTNGVHCSNGDWVINGSILEDANRSIYGDTEEELPSLIQKLITDMENCESEIETVFIVSDYWYNFKIDDYYYLPAYFPFVATEQEYSEDLPKIANMLQSGMRFVVLSETSAQEAFLETIQNNGYSYSILGWEGYCCWGIVI